MVFALSVDFLKDGRRTAHHDVQKTKKGNYVYGVNKEVRAPEISKVLLFDEGYIEVTPGREVVWEWYAYEHYDEFEFSEEKKRLSTKPVAASIGSLERAVTGCTQIPHFYCPRIRCTIREIRDLNRATF